MARPKKNPASVKSEMLRIPVTEQQKSQITDAARLAGYDMAEWARQRLLLQRGGRFEFDGRELAAIKDGIGLLLKMAEDIGGDSEINEPALRSVLEKLK